LFFFFLAISYHRFMLFFIYLFFFVLELRRNKRVQHRK